MSDASSAARVTLLVADYASFAPDGRLNIIGGAFQATAPTAAGLPPQTIVVIVEVPQTYAGEQVAVSVTLRDRSGVPIELEQADGTKSVLRAAQVAVLSKHQIPNVHVPADVPCRIGMALAVPPGIPLPAGETYYWTAEVDGEARPEWQTSFFYAPLPAGPVFG